MLPIAFLLAAQGAGMVVDYIGTSEQQRVGDLGAKLQQASIESNIEQTRLQAEDDSLQSLRALRQNLGTQAAVYAARGTNPGQGSAVSYLEESIGNFNSDERMKRMNLLGKTTELKSQGLISKLNQSGSNTKLWSGFAQRTFNTLSTNPKAYGSDSSSAFSGSSASGFGLTQKR